MAFKSLAAPAALLALAGSLAGLWTNLIRSDGLKLFGPTRSQSLIAEFKTISLAEATSLWQAGTVPFVDTRPRENYEQGHIPRALYGFPEDEAASSALFGILDPHQVFVIYCAGGECKDTLLLANKLKPLGYTEMRLFMGGWPEWTKAGLPIEKGK